MSPLILLWHHDQVVDIQVKYTDDVHNGNTSEMSVSHAHAAFTIRVQQHTFDSYLHGDTPGIRNILDA